MNTCCRRTWRFGALACAMFAMTVSAAGQEAIVRISDGPKAPAKAASASGRDTAATVRISDRQTNAAAGQNPYAFASQNSCGQMACGAAPGCAVPQPVCVPQIPTACAPQPYDCYTGNCYADGYDQRLDCFINGSCQSCDSGCGPGGGNCLTNFWHGQSMTYAARNRRLSEKLFGWMVPSGCCGEGCPPVGAYHNVYPQNVSSFDQRDGQLYGAQGTGIPMTVPLAPNVRHTYNYGWGVPSSRVTPVSTPGHTMMSP